MLDVCLWLDLLAASHFTSWSWCLWPQCLDVSEVSFSMLTSASLVLFFLYLYPNIQIPHRLWKVIFLLNNKHQVSWEKAINVNTASLQSLRGGGMAYGNLWFCVPVPHCFPCMTQAAIPEPSPDFCLSVGLSLACTAQSVNSSPLPLPVVFRKIPHGSCWWTSPTSQPSAKELFCS